jgi:hypothetical protein
MYIAFYIAATGVACYYTTTGLTGTLKLEEYYEDEYQMAINFENQRLKLYKPDSNKACSKSGTITAPFAFQSREMSSERAWYILGKLVG